MPNYHVNIYAETDWASTTLRAKNPEHALFRAHDLEMEMLDFERYDSRTDVERIEIRDQHDEIVAEWRSPDLALRFAARDLLDAAEAIVAQIGELHGESSVIDEDIGQGEAFGRLRAAIARAKAD